MPSFVVRDHTDVLGFSVYPVAATLRWDAANASWNAITPTASAPNVGSPNVLTTRANKATVWDSGALLEFDGSQWASPTIAVSGAPNAVSGYSIVGLRNGEMILFGGVDASNSPLSETWKLDAQNVWSQLNPSSSPSPRANATVAEGPAGNLILFGGVDASTFLDDTWFFDGVTWSQVAASGPPAPRAVGVLVYRASTNSYTLLGGIDAIGGGVTDAWILNGTTWTQAFTDYSAAWSGAMAANDEIVSVAPSDSALVIGSLSGFASHGAGCACGTSGTLTLGATGTSVLGESYTLLFSGYAPTNQLLIAWDVVPAAQPFPFPGLPAGCNQNIPSLGSYALVANSPPASPAPTFVLTVPDNTALIGARTVFQAVQPPQSGFAGCASNALDVRIGRF